MTDRDLIDSSTIWVTTRSALSSLLHSVCKRVSSKMGNYFTVDMEENYRRNQEFITEMNTVKVGVFSYAPISRVVTIFAD